MKTNNIIKIIVPLIIIFAINIIAILSLNLMYKIEAKKYNSIINEIKLLEATECDYILQNALKKTFTNKYKMMYLLNIANNQIESQKLSDAIKTLDTIIANKSFPDKKIIEIALINKIRVLIATKDEANVLKAITIAGKFKKTSKFYYIAQELKIHGLLELEMHLEAKNVILQFLEQDKDKNIIPANFKRSIKEILYSITYLE